MTHGAWHDLVHLAAAVALVGGGGILVGLSWIARSRSRPGPAPDPSGMPVPAAVPGAVLVATLSLAAAAIHLAAAPAHIEDLGLAGWSFVGIAGFQAAWALAWGIERSQTAALVGIVGNLAVVAVWLVSRTVGLAVAGLAATPEPIGTPDAAATLFELLLIGALVARRSGHIDALERRIGDARSVATIAVVPAIGTVFLVTTLAVSLALDHSHATGGDHGRDAPAVRAGR
jgi:hypothetical protein